MKLLLPSVFPAGAKNKSGNAWRMICCAFCFVFTILMTHSLCAQEIVRPDRCDSTAFTVQIDSLKWFYKTNGYLLLRESSLKMESQYEMPVMLPLRAKEWYHFCFIGDPTSSLLELRMFDAEENNVYFEKKVLGDENSSVISFTFIPQKSTYYLIRPVQKNKHKNQLCAYLLLFRKTALP